MGIYGHLTTFAGYPLLEWTPDLATVDNPAKVAFAVRLSWEDYKGGTKQLTDRFATLLSRPYAAQIEALVIGSWGYDSGPDDLIKTMVATASKLPNLKALFVGDIHAEESEISWINQGFLGPLWPAFPTLEHLGIRGGDKLDLGKIVLPNLKSLRIETGGLKRGVVQAIGRADWPALEELVLWLGTENYGATTRVEDLKPFYQAAKMPRLKYLGLCNSDITDEIAVYMATAPLLQRLEVLDLSMGTLSDEGALALLTSPHIKHLRQLDLHHHFLSDAMMRMLAALKNDHVAVDLSEAQEMDDDWRFVAVSE